MAFTISTQATIAGINMTPMTGVPLVLIAIFMVLTQFTPHGATRSPQSMPLNPSQPVRPSSPKTEPGPFS